MQFLSEYRRTFRKYVEEAIDLSKEIDNITLENKKEYITNIGFLSPVEKEFEADVRELEIKSVRNTNDQKNIVLYGSSTFRLWKDPQGDLSTNNLSNLGFGGSTLQACRFFFDRLVLPKNPNMIFLYAGDNDIGNGKSSTEVIEEFNLFVDQVHEKLPQTKCYFISIKPSPFRSGFQKNIIKTNKGINDIILKNKQWKYIDLFSLMVDKKNKPSDIFYGSDPLHMNSIGYSLLAKLIRDEITFYSY